MDTNILTKRYELAFRQSEVQKYQPVFAISDPLTGEILCTEFKLDNSEPRFELYSQPGHELIGKIRFLDRLARITLRGNVVELKHEGHIRKKTTFTTWEGQHLTWTSHLKGMVCKDEAGKQVAFAHDGGLTGYGHQRIEVEDGQPEEVLVTALAMVIIARKPMSSKTEVIMPNLMLASPGIWWSS